MIGCELNLPAAAALGRSSVQLNQQSPNLSFPLCVRRDRVVDESGNQIAIFGRRGARPFNYEELRRMYLIDGKLFTVTDAPAK